jgi:hypothetical protein
VIQLTASTLALGVLIAMSTEAAADDKGSPTHPSPSCVARHKRHVDNRLSGAEIDAIEYQVRQDTKNPVIEITFERRKGGNRPSVVVKVLDRCDDEEGAAGPLLYVRRFKGEWRLDRRRMGRWSSVKTVVY